MMRKNGITDLSAIVQSYNFGRAYLRWLASNKKQHSLPVADLYSKTVVAPSLGNTTGAMVRYSNPIAVAYNGGYRYKNGGISSTLKLLSNMLILMGELILLKIKNHQSGREVHGSGD